MQHKIIDDNDINPSIEPKVTFDNVVNFVKNANNILIDKKFINGVLKKNNVDYKIKNLKLFQTAMTHTSYIEKYFKTEKMIKIMNSKSELITECIESDYDQSDGCKSIILPFQEESYERMEFLGDSIIKSILANYLYDRYPEEDEGFLTKLKAKMENKRILSKLSILIGFDKYIIIGKYIEDIYGRKSNTNIMEDVMEAFVGALKKDSGDYELCNKFVINLVENEVNIPDLIKTETNFKDILMQHYHSRGWKDPVYTLVKQAQTQFGKKEFEIIVKSNKGLTIGRGSGTNKKQAEQNAAKMALKYYKKISDDVNDEQEKIYEIE